MCLQLLSINVRVIPNKLSEFLSIIVLIGQQSDVEHSSCLHLLIFIQQTVLKKCNYLKSEIWDLVSNRSKGGHGRCSDVLLLKNDSVVDVLYELRWISRVLCLG